MNSDLKTGSLTKDLIPVLHNFRSLIGTEMDKKQIIKILQDSLNSIQTTYSRSDELIIVKLIRQKLCEHISVKSEGSPSNIHVSNDLQRRKILKEVCTVNMTYGCNISSNYRLTIC
jgi:hypothetical protein